MKCVIMLGLPGSGKGTVAIRLAKEIGFIHLSTGDLFRKAIADRTPLGLQVESLLSSGTYVPDDVTNQVVADFVTKSRLNGVRGIIFDGYPRTMSQSEFLEKILPCDVAVLLDISIPEATERLAGRRTCPKCKSSYHIKFKPPVKSGVCDNDQTSLIIRPDDEVAVISKRIDVYQNSTALITPFYKKTLITIKASELDTTYLQVLNELRMRGIN